MKITKYLLYTSTALIPFYIFRMTIFGIPTNLFELFVALSAISFIPVFVAKFPNNFKFGTEKTQNLLILLFFLTSLIGLINSNFLLDSAGIIKSYYICPIIYYLLLKFSFKKEEIPKISICLLFSLILVAFWSILQKIGVIGTLFYQTNDPTFNQYLTDPIRVFAGFESPNALAMFVLPALLLSLPASNYLKEKFSSAIINIALPLIAIFVLILAGSRAALLASLSVVATATCYLKRTIKNNKILLALGLIALISLIFFLSNSSGRAGSNHARVEIYAYSLELIKHSPLFGIGFASFQSEVANLSKDNLPFIEFTLPYALHPHNIFLAFILNAGLLHLISFLALTFFYLKKGLTASSNISLFASLALVAMLVHGFFDTTYFKNDLSALFFLALAFIDINQKND